MIVFVVFIWISLSLCAGFVSSNHVSPKECVMYPVRKNSKQQEFRFSSPEVSLNIFPPCHDAFPSKMSIHSEFGHDPYPNAIEFITYPSETEFEWKYLNISFGADTTLTLQEEWDCEEERPNSRKCSNENLYVFFNCYMGYPIFDDEWVTSTPEDPSKEKGQIYIRKNATDALLKIGVSNSPSGESYFNVTIKAEQIKEEWQQLIFKNIMLPEGDGLVSRPIYMVQLGNFMEPFSRNNTEEEIYFSIIDMKHIYWVIGHDPSQPSMDPTVTTFIPTDTVTPETLSTKQGETNGWSIAACLLGIISGIICVALLVYIISLLQDTRKKMLNIEGNAEYENLPCEPRPRLQSVSIPITCSNNSRSSAMVAEASHANSPYNRMQSLNFAESQTDEGRGYLHPPILPPPPRPLAQEGSPNKRHTLMGSPENFQHSSSNIGESDYDNAAGVMVSPPSDEEENDYDYIDIDVYHQEKMKERNTGKTFMLDDLLRHDSENSLYIERKQLESQEKEAENQENQEKETENLERQEKETENLERQENETENLENQEKETENFENQKENENLERQEKETENLENQEKETENLKSQTKEPEYSKVNKKNLKILSQEKESENFESQENENIEAASSDSESVKVIENSQLLSIQH